MRNNHLCNWFYVVFLISFFFLTCSDGKGFGGRGGGGGFRGGSRGGGSSGAKGPGTFGGGSSYNRGGGYNNMGKPHGSGSSFKSNAMSFGAGALGGVAAYSLMRSMSHSYRPGYYDSGYGYGDTCYNNEELNGTRFGSFRCPLNGFPYEARYCCGESGKQFCCTRETSSRFYRGASNLGWIFLVVVICIIGICLLMRHLQRKQKDVILVPVEPPPDEPQGRAYYQPPPPPMGYPPPPMGNPYAPVPQNYEGDFNPYLPQQPMPHQMPYPPQQPMPHQMPYQPQQPMPHQMPYQPQQQAFNPYQVKEGGPPAYDDAVRYNQGMPAAKPM